MKIKKTSRVTNFKSVAAGGVFERAGSQFLKIRSTAPSFGKAVRLINGDLETFHAEEQVITYPDAVVCLGKPHPWLEED